MAPLDDLVGESPPMLALKQKLERLIPRSDARRLPPILIQGETGSGKGLLARVIHRAGPRAGGPFVDLNCAAIPDTLLEAELFGFERGAFTDARRAKIGLFQAANRGTLFLDEVGLLPETLQAKLLKAIEERTVRRLGANQSEPVDVWIVAATNEDLALAVRERRFRDDLYHRIAVLSMIMPPLRERGSDVLLLAEHFLTRACGDYGLTPKRLTDAAKAALLAYPWPGNIRELANVIERVALLFDDAAVTVEALALPDLGPATPAVVAVAPPTVQESGGAGDERTRLLEALEQTKWNISQTAARLGITRNALRYRIEKHRLRPGMRPPRPARPAEPAPTTVATLPAARAKETAVKEDVHGPASIRWERRRLTLMRVALTAAADSDPTADASRYFEAVVDKVRTFGGRVEDLSTVSLTAVFGLEPIEDAPRRAALAAMAVQRAIARDTDEGFTLRVGIHVDQFMVGRVIGVPTIETTAKQQASGVLQDLVARADPETIVVSDGAARFLNRRFDLMRLTGSAAVGVYRLVGRERAGLSLGERMARFVGRGNELDLLRARFDATVRGQGQVVGIAGEAGIGKSRLLFEFRQSLAQPVTYLEAHCLSYGTAVPYLAVIDLLRASCGISEGDGADVIAERVRVTLEELGLDPASATPLLRLLGLDERSHRLVSVDLEAMKAQTFNTLSHMILERSRRTPVVLVVEDLHWIDRISEEYFTTLVDAVPGARILLLATHRPGYRPPWIERSYAMQMPLQPLAPDASAGVVRSILGGTGVADAVVEMILAKAEGNPFFLEELARSVREHDGTSPALAVPDTIEEVILARIDRLAADEKRLLQTASVIGKQAGRSLLQSVAEMDDADFYRALQRLQAAEFLYETGFPPEREYIFNHALTQEVTYGTLLPERRRAVHAAVVGAIERLYPGRLGDLVDRLAEHAVQGEVWDKAVTYLRQAGHRAATRSAHQEAVACFERALTALGHRGDSRATTEESIDLRIDLRNSLLLLGQERRMLENLREAERLAEALGDQRRLGWVSTYMTHYFWWMGDADRAIDAGQRALTVAASTDDFILKLLTNFHLGQAFHALGDYRRAIRSLAATIAAINDALMRERFGLLYAVRARAWLVWAHAELGEFDEGIARGEEGIRIAETVDQPFSLITAYVGVGMLHLRRGNLDPAVAILERGLELCRARDLPVLFPTVASRLGVAYALGGRLDDGLPLLERAAKQAATMRRLGGHSFRLAHLAEAYLLAGRIDEATEAAERALDLSRDHRELAFQAWTLRLLAEIAARRNPPDVAKADELFSQSAAVAEDLAMRPLQALCHLGRGTLDHTLGRRDRARAELAAAISLLRAMQMTLWLPRAERLLADLS